MGIARGWLTELREAQGLTHNDVAVNANIARVTYTQIELGLRNPSVKTAKRIANVLGFEWTNFFNQNCHEKQQLPHDDQTTTEPKPAA